MLSETELLREQQVQVLRIAERTLAQQRREPRACERVARLGLQVGDVDHDAAALYDANGVSAPYEG